MNEVKNNLFYRAMDLDRARVNNDDRSIDLSFSSEAEIPRWFGKEILLHGPDNVDLSRLKRFGSGLLNHNPNIIVGPLKDIRVEDKKGRARLMFDDDEDGNKALQKVKSGSLKGVSVGYAVYKFREIKNDEEWSGIKGPAMIATRWAPHEISLTPIPADASVGIGRDLSRSLEGIEIETSTHSPYEPIESITVDELMDLSSRAAAIGPDAQAELIRMVAEGEDSQAIERVLINSASGIPDAEDKGGPPAIPPIQRKQTPGASVVSFTQIDDDTFIRGLTNPSHFIG